MAFFKEPLRAGAASNSIRDPNVTVDAQTGAVLIMLDSFAPSPCHEFKRDEKRRETMSRAVLRDVLMLVGRLEGGVPLVFSVGSLDALDSAVLKTLRRLDCEWVVRSEVLADLGSEDLPTLVVFNLEDGMFASAESADVQYAMVHVSPDGISRFIRDLRGCPFPLYSLTLRAQDLDRFQEGDFLNYERQLAALGREILEDSRGLYCPNLGYAEALGCGAGTTLLTVAPDGHLYPCPAFYHAGKSHALATVHDLIDEPGWQKRIRLSCDNLDCRACAFLSHTRNGNADEAFRFSEAESRAKWQLPHVAIRSRKAWRGFCALHASVSRQKTCSICNDAYIVLPASGGLGLDMFCQALMDIWRLVMGELCMNDLPPASSREIQHRWQPSAGVASNTRDAIFRANVLEIVEELLYLRSQTEAGILRGDDDQDSDKCGDLGDATGSQVTIRLHPVALNDIWWRYTVFEGLRILIRSARDDCVAGFTCTDLDWIETELELARMRIEDWFQESGREHGLPSGDGWNWFVDFESLSLIAVRGGSPEESERATDIENCCDNSEWLRGRVPLSDEDVELVQSIQELFGALIDEFRSRYPNLETFAKRRAESEALLRMLGDVSLGLDSWYREETHEPVWAPSTQWVVNFTERALIRPQNRDLSVT